MATSLAAERLGNGTVVPAPYVISSKHQETHDVWTICLTPAARALPPFSPGQFAMLYAFGAGEVPISLSGGLEQHGPLLHTLRAAGTVTGALCGLATGMQVGVRGPFGRPWPLSCAEGHDVVVIGGGIGLAPLRPVIQAVLAARERFGRVIIAYGGRSPAELLYLDELERWRGRFDVELDVTVDNATAGWRGRVGVVTTLIPRAEIDPEHSIAFVCGPEVMMRFTVATLRDTGLPAEHIHVSMERNMKCAVGHCGHCQLREHFICKDGPVFSSDVAEPLMRMREL